MIPQPIPMIRALLNYLSPKRAAREAYQRATERYLDVRNGRDTQATYEALEDLKAARRRFHKVGA